MADHSESRRSEAARPVLSKEPDTLQPTVAPEVPPAGAATLAPQIAPQPAPPAAETNEPPSDVPDYDPAEYRWVPVRRVPRLDGWTEEKQRRFIETLADTGLVNVAAKAVGMSRESAHRLRRAAHGAPFARAWDAARHHAGGLIEDIAFERAIQGVEHEVYNDCGEVIGARLVHDNRLLKYLLSHLKPERYGRDAGGRQPPPAAGPAIGPVTGPAPEPANGPAPALQESLRAMEAALPAPAEELMAPDELEDALLLADAADGALPPFLAEQRPPKSAECVAAEEMAARTARGAAALARREAGHTLSDEEFADECYYLDPASNARRRRPSR